MTGKVTFDTSEMISAIIVEPDLAKILSKRAEQTIVAPPARNKIKPVSLNGKNDSGVIAGKKADIAYILLVRGFSFRVEWYPAMNS